MADSGTYLPASPESLASRRRLAESMIKGGADYSPVQSWTQGMARVAQALSGVALGTGAEGDDRRRTGVGRADDLKTAELLAGLPGLGGVPLAAEPDAASSQPPQAPVYAPQLPAAPTQTELPGVAMAPSMDSYATPTAPETGAIGGGLPNPQPTPITTPAASPGPAINPQVATYIKALLANKSTRDLGLKMYQQYMPEPSKPTDDMREYEFYRAQEMTAGREPKAFHDYLTGLKRAGAINIDQREETEEAKGLGKAAAERANKTMELANSGIQQLQRLSQLQSIMDEIETGRLAPAQRPMGAWGRALGVDDETMRNLGIDPNMAGTAEAFEAISNRMMVDMIGQGGFPANNFSDADRGFLLTTVPQLEKTPGGNAIVIEARRRMAQRDIEKASAWRKFRRNPENKGKGFDDFEMEWNEAISAKDIMGDLKKEAEQMLAAGRPASPATTPTAASRERTWNPSTGRLE